MSDKRRAEIEAKRTKLAELRKARAERQKADADRRLSESVSTTAHLVIYAQKMLSLDSCAVCSPQGRR